MIVRLCWLAVLMLSGHVHASESFAGVVTYVTDGDTLWVQPDAGGTVKKLRIDGIDAPEICQAGGEASRDTLSRQALRQRVSVVVRRYDVYGRGLARIELQGRDLGGQMVRSGQAWSYRWRRDAGPYAMEEAAARQSRAGLFASGVLVRPRDFRKQHGSCHVAQ
jgi:micrococcal nuclease